MIKRGEGDVDWQPKTDNILITIGGQESDLEGKNAGRAPDTQRWARLLEVTHETPSEIVWDMRLQDTGLGWAIYRGDRLSTLYP